MTAKKILIVGGGIAGLTLAVLAGRRGCAVTVLESMAQFNDGGYVIGVWKNGCTVLWDMGLGEQVESTGRQSAYQLLSDEKGRELKRTDLSRLASKHGSAVRFMTRGTLHKILQNALSDTTNIHFNRSVAELRPDHNHVVVRDTAGEEDTFDIVVGSDGIHSTTRKLLFHHDAVLRHNAVFYYGAAVCKDWNKPLLGDVEMLGRGTFLGVYPVSDDECGFYAALYPGGQFLSEPAESVLRREFADFGWQAPALLRDLRPPIFGDWIQETAPSQWSRGRCVLIGDAAHALLPTTGQGISLALEDAFLLDQTLAQTSNDHDALARAWATFEQRRRARIEPIRRRSRRINLINRLATRNNPLFCRFRNALVRMSLGSAKERRLDKFFSRNV